LYYFREEKNKTDFDLKLEIYILLFKLINSIEYILCENNIKIYIKHLISKDYFINIFIILD